MEHMKPREIGTGTSIQISDLFEYRVFDFDFDFNFWF
jgi:hypothetical protein